MGMVRVTDRCCAYAAGALAWVPVLLLAPVWLTIATIAAVPAPWLLKRLPRVLFLDRRAERSA